MMGGEGVVGNDEGERGGGRQEGRGQGVEDSDGGEGVVNSERGGQRMVGSEGGEGEDAYRIEYRKMTTTLSQNCTIDVHNNLHVSVIARVARSKH